MNQISLSKLPFHILPKKAFFNLLSAALFVILLFTSFLHLQETDKPFNQTDEDVFELKPQDYLKPKAATRTCRILERSSLKHKKVTLARVLGPSLEPLQAPNQQSINLKFILEHELEVRKSHSCVRQIWILTCMFNKTERLEYVKLLRKHKQVYFRVKGCAESGPELYSQLQDVNKVRNLAIQKALERPTDWVLPLDGNLFIPADALQKTVHSLVVDSVVGNQIHTVVFFRVLQCQNQHFTDRFLIDREFENSYFQIQPKYPVVTENLSKKEEGQIAIAAGLENATSFFSEKKKYGHYSKLSIIEKMSRREDMMDLRCGAEAGNEDKSRSFNAMRHYANLCGYVLRLEYWPGNDKCPSEHERLYPEIKMTASQALDQARKQKDRVEVSRSKRASMRIKSIRSLKQKLKMSLDSSDTEEVEQFQ